MLSMFGNNEHLGDFDSLSSVDISVVALVSSWIQIGQGHRETTGTQAPNARSTQKSINKNAEIGPAPYGEIVLEHV